LKTENWKANKEKNRATFVINYLPGSINISVTVMPISALALITPV